MAEDPNFVPVFGPNGAVMNAPSMTPEMRTKIEQAQALPSGEAAFKSLRPFFLVVFFSALFSAFAEPVRDFLAASQRWAGAVTGALTAIAMVCGWFFARSTLRRWELIPRQDRLLRLPIWARVTLAVSDLAMGFGLILLQVNFLTDFDGQRSFVTGVSLAVLLIAAMIGWLLRALADETKWAWRTERLAALATPRQHHEQRGQQHADNAR